MCRIGCKLLVISIIGLVAGISKVSAQSPSGCQGSGVTLNFSVFFADGTTSAAGQTLSPCETIIYQTQLCQAGGNQCNLQGGSLTLTLPDGSTVDVTPAGGIGTLSGGGCTTPVNTTYVVNVPSGNLASASLNYRGTALTGGAGTAVNATIGLDNTVGTCDDNNLCTTDTCDPSLIIPIQPSGFRMGGCVNTPITCNDNNPCTTDTCDPASGCVFTPITCNDNNACTTDTCDPATGCVFTPNANCQHGCTPGFFKNCTGQWPVPTTTLLSDAFPCLQAANLPSCLSGCSAKFSTITLLNALSLKGGSTTCGAAETLARAAAAAYLNSLRVSYPVQTGDLITEVCNAFASCDRTTIINEAARLDTFNNLGCKDAQGVDLPCKPKL
jgi:hypothetical protein